MKIGCNMEEYNYIKRFKTVPIDIFIRILKYGTTTGHMSLSPDGKYYFINRGSYLEKVKLINIEKAYPPYETINKEEFLKNVFNELRRNKIEKIKKIINKNYEIFKIRTNSKK